MSKNTASGVGRRSIMMNETRTVQEEIELSLEESQVFNRFIENDALRENKVFCTCHLTTRSNGKRSKYCIFVDPRFVNEDNKLLILGFAVQGAEYDDNLRNKINRGTKVADCLGRVLYLADEFDIDVMYR